jgi:hypothetical protein
MDIEGIQFLQVTSKLAKSFTARYHGEEYVFKLNEPVTMPVAAAAHIFGVGETNKLPAFHRLGWVTVTAQLESAMKKLKDIKFEPVKQVYELSQAMERRDALPGDTTTGAAASES